MTNKNDGIVCYIVVVIDQQLACCPTSGSTFTRFELRFDPCVRPSGVVVCHMNHGQEKQRDEIELMELQREFQNTFLGDTTSTERRPLHPAIAVGIGGFVIINVGLLLSLPPVLMGRGAPYLPTYKNKMDQMFAPLKAHYQNLSAITPASSTAPTISSTAKGSGGNRKLTFVDLGSGDGRVVFRAAREGLFHQSIGYEINPCE